VHGAVGARPEPKRRFGVGDVECIPVCDTVALSVGDCIRARDPSSCQGTDRSRRGIAYAKFFFDQVNVAWTEPRAGLIESLSDPACKFCAFTEQKAMKLVGSKLRYRKAPIEMLSVEAVVGAPQGQQYLVASLEQKRVDVVNASGVVVDSDERLVSESYVVLKWADGWMLREVEEAE
jgi:hypothetical protein